MHEPNMRHSSKSRLLASSAQLATELEGSASSLDKHSKYSHQMAAPHTYHHHNRESESALEHRQRKHEQDKGSKSLYGKADSKKDPYSHKSK